MKIEFIDSLSAISAAAWNAVAGTDYPFTRHEFLYALEQSGAADADSGWQPLHALIKRDGELIAVMPLYLKYHSYGEYVFDWAWADAYQRYGRRYYPKLLGAIPFTPATGPRLCVLAGEDSALIAAQLIAALRKKIDSTDISSLHILFPNALAGESFAQAGMSERWGAQYHWFNRGYSNFDDFLATFASRKRKNLRKERERVIEQDITITVLDGEQIGAAEWKLFHHFYELTYAKRSGHGGYLNAEFFRRIGAALPQHIVMTLAYWRGEAIGGALYFRDSTTLYGRYWGCVREFDFLHFEACYYQGIEYCIRHQLAHFDPGAQGEHKIQRGFEPIKTLSYHWLKDKNFRHAIDDFLLREQPTITEHIAAAAELLPFKQTQNDN
ncbi:MAG: family N-acetyltransferase [Verrucomicrobiaceae bacterium]|nr:family N-acetyltransferase [Verrucomicrobiaceae bacterium]